MHVKKNLKLWLAVFALALPLLFVGTASAMYMSDGAAADPTGTAGWITPNDMVCIKGLHTDGTIDLVAGVTNARDCIYYNTGLTSMNPVDVTAQSICAATNAGPFTASCATAANCKFTAPAAAAIFSLDNKCYDTQACLVPGAVNNDGAKHAVATSICVDGSGNGISLKDMDRTFAMCAAKGGTWKQTTNTTYVVSGVTTTQVPFTPGYGGSCIAYGRQFKGQDANGTPLAFGAKGTAANTNGQGYCYTTMNMTTAYGTAALCPSNQAAVAPFNANAAYDWAFSSSKCTYAKGIAGYINAALTKANGTLTAANAWVDLRQYTTMGDCLAAGASWNNWVGVAASTVSIPTTSASTIPAWDYTKQAPDADKGCLHCHSTLTQYNGPSERMKDSYLKTGHKNMLRKATAGKKLVGPDGVAYTTDGTNAINFMTSSDPYAKITVGGVAQNLYYVYGDWMIALPTVVYGKNGYGSAPTGTTTDNNGYSCYACHTTGVKDNSNIGVSGIGTPGYAGTEPANSFPGLLLNAANPKWDLDGIQCARCHNAEVGPVNQTMINASAFPATAPTSGGMGALAAGTGRANLCFGCHQSIGKDWPAGTTSTDPTKIPTGVSHGAAPGRDFNGHVLGNSFLNSVHSNYTGTIRLNSIGKYDLSDPNGTSEYNSIFKGYTCWQSPTTNSPGRTKADGTEIKTKSECETLYGAGSWRADASGDLGTKQGSCTTCHDVHNSLFVASQEEAAIRKTCTDCHVNNATTGATDAAAPQIVLAQLQLNHPTGSGTPFDTSLFGDDSCAVCHMATQAEVNGDQNTMPAHVWRISTDANYNTFPTVTQFYGGACSVHTGTVVAAATKFVQAIYPSDASSAACTSAGGTWTSATKNQNAQTAPDGTYTNAVWVDLDMACGQCHGGSGGPTATHNNAFYITKAVLAEKANGIHSGGTSTVPPSTLIVSHGTVTISSYTVSFLDTSSEAGFTGSAVVTVNWGDGNSVTQAADTLFTHTYTRAKPFTILHVITDGAQYASEFFNVTVPQKFTVSGTVLAGTQLALRQNNHTVKVLTASQTSGGTYTFSNVLPQTSPVYTIKAYKKGTTFNAVAAFSVTANVVSNITTTP